MPSVATVSSTKTSSSSATVAQHDNSLLTIFRCWQWRNYQHCSHRNDVGILSNQLPVGCIDQGPQPLRTIVLPGNRCQRIGRVDAMDRWCKRWCWRGTCADRRLRWDWCRWGGYCDSDAQLFRLHEQAPRHPTPLARGYFNLYPFAIIRQGQGAPTRVPTNECKNGGRRIWLRAGIDIYPT